MPGLVHAELDGAPDRSYRHGLAPLLWIDSVRIQRSSPGGSFFLGAFSANMLLIPVLTVSDLFRSDAMTQRPKRRTILLATGAAALAAGCGDSGGDDSGSTEQTAEITETPGTGETGQDADPPEADGEELATTDEIPVGGGKIFKDEKVVVTQPEEGQFKAFSAICTHQQCIVANVEGGTINCTCHGSKYSITDGAVENPPATRPLPAEKIEVDGNSIRLT